uniref:ANK_REP_REGION domain-containing protein n=1 Tax=Macrostomum lignano TaxID=282301 RepID=A0A1I8JAN9_9PLAT
ARNNITPLHVAAKWGMLPVVQKLLEHGAEVDCKTRDGLTPLHCASRSGQYAVVDQLLGSNASFGLKSRSGLSPLHMATQGDHVDCARLLLTRGANLDDTTIDLLTPLHVAAHCGYTRVAKLLLDHRCMVNARALNGFTPLHIACKKNRIRVIELLLQFGCAVEAATESGLTPLHVAAFMGHNSVALLLLQHGANVNSLTVRTETPLHLSVRSGQLEASRALLRCGAQPDARAKDNQTPLHVASRLGNAEIVALLLQSGASPDATCKDNYTALHVAAREGHEEVATLLLDHKASLQLTTKKGATPLHNAAKYDKAGVAKVLLSRGADPNARGRNGLTPLHLAAHYNRTAVTATLLEAKANPNCVASNGYTPLHIASRKNHLDLAGQLLSAGANPRAESKSGFAPLHLAAQEGRAEMCALLCSRGAGVDQASHNGITPLHLAAQEDRVPAAEVLVVQHGGQVDPHTKAGYTPLHTASFFGQAAMVKFLLRQGAGANALTQQQFTPLHVAAQQGHLQVVSLLLEAGADPNLRNSRNWTPAHIAKKQNYINIFELLRRVTTIIENWEEEIILEETIEISKPDTVAEHVMSESDDEAATMPRPRLKDWASRPEHQQLDSVLEDGSRLNATTLMRSDSYNEWSSSADYLKDEMQYTTGRLESVIEATGPSQQEDESMQPAGSTELLLTSPFYASTVSNLALQQPQQQPTIPEEGSAVDGEDNDDEDDVFVTQPQQAPPVDKQLVVEAAGLDAKFEAEAAGQAEEDGIPVADEVPTNQSVPKLQPPSTPNPPKDKDQLEPVPFIGDAASVDETTNDIEKIGTLSSQKESAVMEQIEPSSYMSQYKEPETLTPPENYITGRDNVPPQRVPVVSGFLVSFLVDARGGAMDASRWPGLRVVIPPSAASAPTRVTCRLMRPGRVARPPQLNDGEGLACRIIELGPHNAPFNGHVLLELPHYASLREREREIVVLRSETGDTWKEHTVEATDQAVMDAVGGFFGSMESNEEMRKKRIIRVLTNSFPQYLALVTRVRQESALIGPEGGVLSSTVVSQVQAVFPEGALTKKIRVAIQALPVPADQVTRLLGPRLAVSPVVTIEPRRRKFHKPITLTIPLPRPASRGFASPGESPTLRLLCSITGGVQPATWEDITGSTPLSYVKDCVSFTTTVSARFWLMDCPNTAESADLAGRLYRDSFVVPYMARFVIYAKRHEPGEAKLRCFCITDDKMDKTLEAAEGFERKAESREVEVLDSRPQWVETVGNLAAITKGNEQLFLSFKAFRENRLACVVRVKDSSQPAVGKVAFLKDPRPTKPTDSPSLKPICTLEVALPDYQPGAESESGRPATRQWQPALPPPRSAAPGEDAIDAARDPRLPPPPPPPTAAEQEQARKAKTEAFLGLIEAMDSLVPEPDVPSPDRDLTGAVEEDIPLAAQDKAQNAAGVEDLLSKMDSMKSESMAPDSDFPDEEFAAQMRQYNARLSRNESFVVNKSQPLVAAPSICTFPTFAASFTCMSITVSLYVGYTIAILKSFCAHVFKLLVELSVPRSVAVSHSAPTRRDAQPAQGEQSAHEPQEDLKSEARRLVEEMMEPEAAAGNSQAPEVGSPNEAELTGRLRRSRRLRPPKCQRNPIEKPTTKDDDQHRHSVSHRHELVRGEPREFVEEEEQEERLPDGTVVRKRIVRRRVVQEVTERIVTEGCADEVLQRAGTADACLEHRHARYYPDEEDDQSLSNQHQEGPEETVEEAEEILPDGSVVRRRVITRHSTDVQVFHGDSEEEASGEAEAAMQQAAGGIVDDALQGAIVPSEAAGFGKSETTKEYHYYEQSSSRDQEFQQTGDSKYTLESDELNEVGEGPFNKPQASVGFKAAITPMKDGKAKREETLKTEYETIETTETSMERINTSETDSAYQSKTKNQTETPYHVAVSNREASNESIEACPVITNETSEERFELTEESETDIQVCPGVTPKLEDSKETDIQVCPGVTTELEVTETSETDVQVCPGVTPELEVTETSETDIQVCPGVTTETTEEQLEVTETSETNIKVCPGVTTELEVTETSETDIQVCPGVTTELEVTETSETDVQVCPGVTPELEVTETSETDVQVCPGVTPELEVTETSETDIQVCPGVTPELEVTETSETDIQRNSDYSEISRKTRTTTVAEAGEEMKSSDLTNKIEIIYEIEYDAQDLTPSYTHGKLLDDADLRSTASQFLDSELDRYPTLRWSDSCENIKIVTEVSDKSLLNSASLSATSTVTTTTTTVRSLVTEDARDTHSVEYESTDNFTKSLTDSDEADAEAAIRAAMQNENKNSDSVRRSFGQEEQETNCSSSMDTVEETSTTTAVRRSKLEELTQLETVTESRRTTIVYELEMMENDFFLWEDLENYRDALDNSVLSQEKNRGNEENLGQSLSSLLDEDIDMEATLFECDQDTENDEEEVDNDGLLTTTKSVIKRRNRTKGFAQYYESSRENLAMGSRSDLMASPINQGSFQYEEVLVDNTEAPDVESKDEVNEAGDQVSIVDAAFDRKILLRGKFVVDVEVDELSSDDLEDSDLEEKLLEDKRYISMDEEYTVEVDPREHDHFLAQGIPEEYNSFNSCRR